MPVVPVLSTAAISWQDLAANSDPESKLISERASAIGFMFMF
jgi:hypothetical protein